MKIFLSIGSGPDIGYEMIETFASPDSKEAKDIAEQFWQLHAQPKESWLAKAVYPS